MQLTVRELGVREFYAGRVLGWMSGVHVGRHGIEGDTVHASLDALIITNLPDCAYVCCVIWILGCKIRHYVWTY